MSEIIPLDVAMQHLYADEADKEQVARKLAGAVAIAENYMGRKIYATHEALQSAQAAAILERKYLVCDDEDVYQQKLASLNMQVRGVVVTPDIETAILLILGTLYAYREDVVAGVAELPMSAKFHLQPYRVMGV